MGKESKIRQLTPMEQVRQELKAKNAEVGSILFSTVGRKDKEALMFPTYVTRQEEGRPVSEFLIVTAKAVKAIRVFNDIGISPWMKIQREEHLYVPTPFQVSQDIVAAREGKGYQDKEHGEEELEFSLDRGHKELTFGILTAKWKHPFESVDWGRGKDGEIYNCRLVNPTEDQVKEMLTANMQRVRGNTLSAIAQKASEALA